MCYSRAEGGQRCHGHAQERASRTAAAYGEAVASGDRARIATASTAYQRACYELASTPQGAEALRATQRQNPDHHEGWQTVLDIGETIRDRNAYLRTVAAADQNGDPHPMQGTVTDNTLTFIRQATDAVQSDPDPYRTLHESARIKRVKARFRTEDEKNASVASWRLRLESEAISYADRANQNRSSTHFVTAMAHLEDMAARAGDTDLDAALNRIPMAVHTNPDITHGPVAADLHANAAPHRRAEQMSALRTVLLAARLRQALEQPVQP